MTTFKMPPIPEPINLDSDSGEGGRGGAIWHTTEDLVAYAAPMVAEIARLRAEVDALAGAAKEFLSATAQQMPEYGAGLQAQVAWADRISAARKACHDALAAVGR